MLLTDRYEITAELGRGGMATVHRARDVRHGRSVAVKTMLPSVAEQVGGERFLREIEIAARLQHPHIVPVFDSGDAAGTLFFVMPLIEGESLRSRLEREGRLPVEDAVRLVREVADALEYAHAEGVVHRDLKPENILLSRGHALLADFGIARLAAGGPDARLTQVGMSLGTPAYMSPEQAAGEGDVGPASDVYALGCILYELLAGEPPFTGPTYEAILVKRFTQDAPRVRARRPEVPAAMDAAIAQALEREPERRPAGAGALGELLAGAMAGGAVPPGSRAAVVVGDRSIVVLPFDNLSPDPNDAYLADGLTEELIADLSRVGGLRVIARNSAAAARARTRDLKEIARMLDVRYLLEGSVRRAGPQLRITAQLIDGTTDAHLWADKYGGTMDDVFEMQERISRTIVDELRVRLTAGEREPRAARTTDPETYELYLRAKYMLGQSVMRFPEARPLLEEVLRRDPAFVPAYGALGTPLVLSTFFGLVRGSEVWPTMQDLGTRALQQDPDSGAGHELLAAVALYRDWDWPEARRRYRRAQELEPGAGFDWSLYAFMPLWEGDYEEAVRAARRARRLDPLSLVSTFVEGAVEAYMGHDDAARAICDRIIEIDQHFPEGYHGAGYVLLRQERWAEALPILERAMALSGNASWPTAKSGCCLVRLGRREEAEARLAELVRRRETEPISALAIATLCLYLGDRAGFYAWMEQGLEDRDPFALSVQREALWDAAREEPEFRAIVRRLGLPE